MGWRQQVTIPQTLRSCALKLKLGLFYLVTITIFGAMTQVQADGNKSRLGLHAPNILPFVGHTLLLNGEGRRIKHFLVLYGCALYLPEPGVPYEEISKLNRPVAFRVNITFNMLPADMPLSWLLELKHAITEHEFQTLQALYGDLVAGDVVVIGYDPAKGTMVTVNDDQRLTVENGFLMRAFISLWISDDPISQELRTKLLSLR